MTESAERSGAPDGRYAIGPAERPGVNDEIGSAKRSGVNDEIVLRPRQPIQTFPYSRFEENMRGIFSVHLPSEIQPQPNVEVQEPSVDSMIDQLMMMLQDPNRGPQMRKALMETDMVKDLMQDPSKYQQMIESLPPEIK